MYAPVDKGHLSTHHVLYMSEIRNTIIYEVGTLSTFT